MKYPILYLVLALAILLPAADALFERATPEDYVDNYNDAIDRAPGLLKSAVGDERININIAMNNSTVSSWGFVTDNAVIVNMTTGGIENPTITVDATEAAIDEIKASYDPIGTFQEKVGDPDGDITIEASGIAANLKIRGLLASTDVLRFFYNIFFSG